MKDRFVRNFIVACLLGLTAIPTHAADEPKWFRISTSRYSFLTDAGDKKGGQALLRIEQMRNVLGGLLLKSKLHLPEPLDIIGVKTDEEYIALAPVVDGRPIPKSGFILHGDDRNYIVLNLADDNSWQTITDDFAYLYLKYNYPPAQSWFDQGLVEYFSTLQLADKQAEIGSTPEGFTALLNTQTWFPVSKLFAAPQSNDPLFRAQSWIAMHYLINQNKLPQTGTYLGLVKNQKIPIDEAIQQAYGVSAAQLDQAVKEYYRSIQTPPAPSNQKAGTAPPAAGITRFTPLGLLEIGTSMAPVQLAEAQSLVAELKVRIPEHRDAAMKDLESLIADPLTESSIQHRALGWALLEKNQPDEATEEFNKAIELSELDPWAHYYRARMKYREALGSGSTFPGLANMLVDLRVVLDWNHEFAEAFNMLAMGRVEGGGVNSAIEVMHDAIQLSPRNETYLLNMALVYLAGKKWDAATGLLDHLKDSSNPKIAADARSYLEQFPNMKKYGILPKRPVDPSLALPKSEPKQTAHTQDAENEERPRQVEAEPDRRKTLFSKGRLLRVDCSQTPAAVLTVTTQAKTMRLRTENYQSLLLMGADTFSCDWKGIPVTVNYKAGGKADGDLVSLEVRQP